MNWDAITAIGTISAAFVGVIGIWINLYEKTKRLSIKFEFIPRVSIYIANNSMRGVIITKIVFSVKQHVFYVDMRSGLSEINIQPGSVERISFVGEEIIKSYKETQVAALCNPSDRIDIILSDNYRRKYRVKTDLTIGMLGQSNGSSIF